MDLRETSCGIVGWIVLSGGKSKWPVTLDTIMRLHTTRGHVIFRTTEHLAITLQKQLLPWTYAVTNSKELNTVYTIIDADVNSSGAIRRMQLCYSADKSHGANKNAFYTVTYSTL
jgi:hypothetical protein